MGALVQKVHPRVSSCPAVSDQCCGSCPLGFPVVSPFGFPEKSNPPPPHTDGRHGDAKQTARKMDRAHRRQDPPPRRGIGLRCPSPVSCPTCSARDTPKLATRTTLNLAQVNKTYNDAVWSVEGVRSMEAKIRGSREFGKRHFANRLFAARHGNVPAVRALLKSPGLDIDEEVLEGELETLHRLADCRCLAIA